MNDRTTPKPDMALFWACFIALVATSFVFGVRSTLIETLGEEFNLNQTEVGQILGVGLWPFALSIVFFSFIIDKIGYKTTAYFAIICHVVAIIMTLTATSKGMLFWGTFVVAIANGTVEAFINPVVATAFPKEKAKWLNILHAGWPLGLALGAIFTILLGQAGISWRIQFGVCLIPVIVYAVLVLARNFPVNERVAAGISYRDMLREVGAVGFFIITWLVVMGVIQLISASGGEGMTFQDSMKTATVVALVVAVAAGLYTKSAGNWMFIVILLIMGPLATTELGTDSWMQELLKADLPHLAGWIFVMVSIIMTVLRFYAGPIVHKFSPIGLLVISCLLAIAGLIFLSKATAGMLVVAAIVYALGKTFLWSTTLGLVSEQFPKGGALTLNGVSAVGVLGMGILGTTLMGLFLDTNIDAGLKKSPELHAKVIGEEKSTMFGKVPSVDESKVAQLPEAEQSTVKQLQYEQKKATFLRQAALPAFMLVLFLILFVYFKAKGGYKPVNIHGEDDARQSDPGF
jgi:MFS transporter, DHA2 family, metal-tetracycline-proton antiporter